MDNYEQLFCRVSVSAALLISACGGLRHTTACKVLTAPVDRHTAHNSLLSYTLCAVFAITLMTAFHSTREMLTADVEEYIMGLCAAA